MLHNLYSILLDAMLSASAAEVISLIDTLSCLLGRRCQIIHCNVKVSKSLTEASETLLNAPFQQLIN